MLCFWQRIKEIDGKIKLEEQVQVCVCLRLCAVYVYVYIYVHTYKVYLERTYQHSLMRTCMYAYRHVFMYVYSIPLNIVSAHTAQAKAPSRNSGNIIVSPTCRPSKFYRKLFFCAIKNDVDKGEQDRQAIRRSRLTPTPSP